MSPWDGSCRWDRTWVLGPMGGTGCRPLASWMGQDMCLWDGTGHRSLVTWVLQMEQDTIPWLHGWDRTWVLGAMDGTRQGSSGWDRTQVLGTTDGPECGSWRPAQDTGPHHSPQLPLPGLLSSADLAEDTIHPGKKVSYGANEADLISNAGDMEPALLARCQELLPCP